MVIRQDNTHARARRSVLNSTIIFFLYKYTIIYGILCIMLALSFELYYNIFLYKYTIIYDILCTMLAFIHGKKGRGRTCCNHGLMELIKWPLISIKILYVFRPGKLRRPSQADVFHRLGVCTAAWVSQALKALSKHCTGSFQASS